MIDDNVIETFEVDGETVVFRYPDPSDLDAFITMHRRFCVEKVLARRLDAESAERDLHSALQLIQANEGSHLLVVHREELVGEGFTHVSGPAYCTVGIALLSRIQDRGIGTRLMSTLERESVRLGARRLLLSVYAANHMARHVYEHRRTAEQCT